MKEKLLQTLPEYKYHGTIRASKIKKIKPIGGLIPLWGDIEVTEPKGVTIRVDSMFLQKYRPQIGGYLVVHEDGYLSYLSEKTFKEGFSRIDDISENETTVIIADDKGMMINLAGIVSIYADGITNQQEEIDLEAADFSDALMWLKEGKKVARRGWNGENQFCWLVPDKQGASRLTPIKHAASGELEINFGSPLAPYGAHFALKNAQGVVVPWVPSVGDLLACDWFVVE
ncbi:TPA: DUF2829 domain-containing protein [Escherichia coli]|uniref:DUF2829 domain-containing protein n=1 Tax=Escherichia coli TaxID=562 RepID=UPI001C3AB670|nr:DUF2829 domain-containing protein [Escherichia coli]MEC4235752.1 DUF2829 domain-containing protein [Escherichia coli]HBH6878547.1 DUF2829 domain-containing protein [Escherichia coli]HCC7635400.1 DUF2829 domain-containing protein [Escherichia coli]HCP3550140.1 DUF2829 domain-containing protein [Escherichia coli]